MRAITRQLFALGFCLITANTSAQEAGLSVSNPDRAYGYTLGDVLVQSISLDDGEIIHTIESPPPIQREGRWVTRQNVQLSPDNKQLSMFYQVVNSPESARLVQLPSLTLTTNQGNSIDIPAWSFSVAPLTPALPGEENALPLMQSDWNPELPSSSALWRNIKTLCAALVISLLLWLGWWIARGLREANTLPFANAYRAIRRHKAGTNDDDAAKWLALHRAFDQIAGRRVTTGSIDHLISSAQWLKPFSTDIRTFYEISSERFFAIEPSQASFELSDLSKRLYKAERRHTSKLEKSSLAAHGMS